MRQDPDWAPHPLTATQRTSWLNQNAVEHEALSEEDSDSE